MITAELNKWSPSDQTIITESGFRYRDTTSIIVGTRLLEANSEHDLFIQFYKLNNSLRYCNGSCYTFIDPVMQHRYKEWIKTDEFKKIHFELYYGNGIVD